MTASCYVWRASFDSSLGGEFRVRNARGRARVLIAWTPLRVNPIKHEKFILEAKVSPSRYYRNPGDVIRDRRLTNRDRLEILDAWEQELRGAQAPQASAKERDEVPLDEVRRLRKQVQSEQTDL